MSMMRFLSFSLVHTLFPEAVAIDFSIFFEEYTTTALSAKLITRNVEINKIALLIVVFLV